MKLFCIPASLFTCKGGFVDQLDFSQLRLEQVPKEIIKSRKHIEELLLNVNSIEELPPDLFRCTKIRRLDVSENKIKVIPPEIGILQSLEELNLSKNEIVEIPEEIGLCQNLAILDIGTNIVTGFPKSFVNLAQLASLNLSNNSLTQLPQDIDRLSNLQFLDVAQCELRFLPASIVRLERLKVLDLCDNYLTELPADMHGMVSLEMLDLHCNMVGRLPEELLRCRSLRNLDLSGNQLAEMPQNIGDLQMLVELVLCENQIRQLPNTIGQLKRLEVLKASKNCLTELTPSICSCSQLTDLILCENQLNELPASLGNLRHLRFLDVNVNNLHSIPSTIGGCQSLGILSLRHNQLSELPMEIGKLNHLQVLDVADNNLKYLPYTLTVLYQAKTLLALWLSFNQPPLPKLTTTNEPIMNIKVLTCYLLPQKDAQPMKRGTSKSCVGGARVCFVGDRREEEEEDKVPIGRFERYDTPHPKPFAPKNRHNRNSGDFSGAVPPPLGANNLQSARSKKMEFSPPDPIPEPSRPLRSVLKRRPQSVLSQISTSDLMPTLLGGIGEENSDGKNGTRKMIRKNIEIKKGDAGFQWTIVGGADSLPHNGKSGLFISNLVPGGVAELAGFRQDDQLLAVNGHDMRGLGHQDAVELIRSEGTNLEVLIARKQETKKEEQKANRRSIPDFQTLPAENTPPALPERFTILVHRSGAGSVGFSVRGTGRWPEDPFTVSAITSTMECPLKLDDRIISVGGANLKFGARLDQVKTLLAGMPGTRVEIVVERGGQWPPPPVRILPSQYGHGPSICGSAFSELTLSRSLPSLLAPLPEAQQSQMPPNSVNSAGAATVIQSVHNDPPSVANSSSSPKQHFHRQYSVRPNATIGPPRPPPRHHRSMSSLIGTEIGEITAEMLRASTPIEYPPGEEPGVILKNAEQQKEKPTNAASNERKQLSMSKSPPTRPTILHHSRLPQPTSSSTTFSAESRNSPIASSPPLPFKISAIPSAQQNSRKSTSNSPPSLPLRMDIGRIEPPLAASSPIPNHHEKSKLSHIPILANISSPPINGGSSKIPPPVAPKPKVVTSNGFNGANYVNTSNHEQPQAVEQQSSTCSPSFSSKLKLFEQMQTTNNGSIAANGLGGGKEDVLLQIGSTAKPSGIPLKKPLVSAHDLEKLREAEEKKRSKMDPQLRNNGEEEVDDEDEHKDTVKELSRLLVEQQNGGGFSSPIGPSVIRTKKAELRAERAASVMENMMNSSSGSGGAEDGGSVSRASSSLSQRAAEIEKRREWRQARLQSMDVESKRTDDLVKLIASATAASAATTTSQQQKPSNTPSPIPIGP